MNLNKEFLKFTKSYFSKIDKDHLKLIPLAGDASSRRYAIAEIEGKSYIACFTDPENNKQNEEFLYWREVYSKNKVKVPKIFHAEPGFILQEYLGEFTLLKTFYKKNLLEIDSSYKQIINTLLKIHSIEIDTDRKYDVFDEKKLESEINMTLKYFNQEILKSSSSTVEGIKNSFQPLFKELASQNKILSHRDFHSKNVMEQRNGEMAVIDFQDSMLGVPQYDLCSLLDDCYFSVPDTVREKMLIYYWEETKDKNLFYRYKSYGQFKKIYDYSKIQRLFKAVGNFSYHWVSKKNPFYLKYIGFAMEKVRLTLLRNPEFDDLRISIFRDYYEN